MKLYPSSMLKMGLLMLFGLFGVVPQGRADFHAKPIESSINVDELKRLLEVAREAGFSNDEIDKITIERDGKVINVADFLRAWEKKRKDKLAREKAYQEKDYLTAQDIFKELDTTQPKDLSKLRDKTVFKE